MKNYLHFLLIVAATISSTSAQSQILKAVKDSSGQGFQNASRFSLYNNSLYFWATSKLWVTDGTQTGTHSIPGSDTFGQAHLRESIVYNNRLYYPARINNQTTLIAVDASSALTTVPIPQVISVNSELVSCNNRLYFVGSDSLHGKELWSTDGTTAGTVMVKDVFPGVDNGIYLDKIVCYDNKIFFSGKSANDDNTELWVSDGTNTGTYQFMDINPVGPSSPEQFHLYNNELFFIAKEGLVEYAWHTNGTPGGTVKLNPAVTNPVSFSSCDGKLFYNAVVANPPSQSLYMSDGTDTGTHKLMSVAFHYGVVCLNGQYFFTGKDGQNPPQLYASDGTANGTVEVAPPGGKIATVYKDRIILIANDGTNGNELWISDGTTAGTFKPLLQSPGYNPMGSSSKEVIEYKGSLYFSGDYGNDGHGFWKFTLWPLNVNQITPHSVGLRVYPNPAMQTINIVTPGSGRIIIGNMLGQEVISTAINKTGTINISHLVPGVYILKDLGTAASVRFVKY